MGDEAGSVDAQGERVMVAVMDTVVHIPPPEDERPRPSRWIGAALAVAAAAVLVVLATQTQPLAPAYEWSRFAGPPGPVNLDSLVALDDGFAVLSGITDDGVDIWWTEDAGSWRNQTLDGSPTQLSFGSGRLAAYRVRSGTVIARDEGAWVNEFAMEFPDETRSRQASGRPSIVVLPDALLELSLFGDVWRSEDGQEFTKVIEDPRWGHGVEQPFNSACRPPSRSSPDVPPLVVADGTIFALVSSHSSEPFGIWPACEPLLWTSDDAAVWAFGTTSLTGDGAYVYDIASRDGMLVAVGGHGIDEPAVWASTDGYEWTDITPLTDRTVVLYRVEAGDAGWILLGRESFSSEPVGWTSTDGSCWEPLPDTVGGAEAVVTQGRMLLVDRADFPGMWMATPTGSPGVCR